MKLQPQYVHQEHANGCAIAVIAMIARLTYRETLNKLGPVVEARITRPNGGFDVFGTFVALQRLGYAVAVEWRGEWGSLRPDWKPQPITDVGIAEAMTSAGAHMIVVLRDGSVLDPAADATPRKLGDYDVNWIAGVVPIARWQNGEIVNA